MTEPLKRWPLLHSKLPPQALKPLPKAAYGIEGLTDINEAYLIQRLFASELPWEWKITGQAYLGHEDRKGRESDYTIRWYLASVSGELVIDGRTFAGSGAHDNKKLDAAYKGAATVAFKNACKLAGLTIELFKDGRAMDHIYESAEKNAATHEDTQGARAETALPAVTPTTPSLAPASSDGQGAGGSVSQGNGTTGPPPKTPAEILQGARSKAPQAQYGTEDAVCPSCGRKEYLGPNGSFCAIAKGGCGWPKGKGVKGTPISYGEYLERQKQ